MKGKKTPTAIKEKVILCRASGLSISETSKLCDVGQSTVCEIMNKYLSSDENRKEFEQLKITKQKEFKEEANRSFNESMIETFETLFTKASKVVNKALDEGKITTKEALTTIGITFDKRQIATGKSTQNINLNFEDLLEKINEGNEY